MSIHNSNIAEDVKVIMLKGEKGDPTPPTDEQAQTFIDEWLVAHPESMIDAELIGETVDDWLDEHPEATTTVQDGAITYAKLNDSLKTYVTPQMFGAKGDGLADDTDAFGLALASGKNILIPDGTYIITESLKIPDGIVFNGTGSKTLLKRYTSNGDYKDFLLIGGKCDVGNFSMEIYQGTNAPMFDGSFIKINEESLSDFVSPTGMLNTKIHDIHAVCMAELESNNEVSAIQLSLEGSYGNSRTGFTGVYVDNFTVRCMSGVMLAYFCHVFSSNSTYWITGINFNDCYIINTKWGFFPLYSDANLFDTTKYSAKFEVHCFGVQMQAQTGTMGFCYLPKSNTVQFNFTNCRPWDFPSYNTYSYYFDYARIEDAMDAESNFINIDSIFGATGFCGIKSDNSLVPMSYSNYEILSRYVCPTVSWANIHRLVPKTVYVPNGTKAVRVCKIDNVSSGGTRNIVFKYIQLGSSSYMNWGTINVHWVAGSDPVLVLDSGLNGIRVGYIVTETNSKYSIEIYLYKTGGIYYLCLESLPFDNTSLGFDNSGSASTYMRTLDMQNYPSSVVNLSEVPENIAVLSPASSKNMVVSGTDSSGNPALYLLGVSNGTLTITKRNYYDI